MSQIGEIRKGTEIGYKAECKFIWYACKQCGKERWVKLRKGRAISNLCSSCAAKGHIISIETKIKISTSHKGEGNPAWKGGRIENGHGYILVKLYPDDFFFPMANCKGYVMEHRLVMARRLGRCLLKTEIVHHRPDVAKDDNRPEVLYLMPNRSEHSKLLPCFNCELKKEIRLFRLQIQNLQEALQGKMFIK